MAVLDGRESWRAEFEAGWLKNYLEIGELDWKIYNMPRNQSSVSGKPTDLANSRLALISTEGFYIQGEQEPFDEPELHGRYDIRSLPITTPAESFLFRTRTTITPQQMRTARFCCRSGI